MSRSFFLLLALFLSVAGLHADPTNAASSAPPPSLIDALRAANPDYQYSPSTLSVNEKAGIIKIAGGKTFSNIDALASVNFCTDLTIHGCNVASLEPIRKFKLTHFDLGDCPVGDLSPIQGMPITDLIVYNTKVKSLDPLRGMPLQTLHTNAISPSFYDVVGSLPTLENLEFAYCHMESARLKKIKFNLKSLGLIHVIFDDAPKADLDDFGPQPLTSLQLASVDLADWTTLSKYTTLKSLTITDTSFDNIQPLIALPLETLIIKNKTPGPLVLTGIEKLRLRELTLNNCLVDLKPVANSPIEQITFTPETVTAGIESLRDCPNLTSVIVYYTDASGKQAIKHYADAKPADALLQDIASGTIKTPSPISPPR